MPVPGAVVRTILRTPTWLGVLGGGLGGSLLGLALLPKKKQGLFDFMMPGKKEKGESAVSRALKGAILGGLLGAGGVRAIRALAASKALSDIMARAKPGDIAERIDVLSALRSQMPADLADIHKAVLSGKGFDLKQLGAALGIRGMAQEAVKGTTAAATAGGGKTITSRAVQFAKTDPLAAALAGLGGLAVLNRFLAPKQPTLVRYG